MRGEDLGVRARGDSGAAVVEFVMMAALLVTMLFAVLQVGTYLYVRTVVAAAAASGARWGSTEGIGAPAGARRSDAVVAAALPVAGRVPCAGKDGIDAESGLRVTTVRCTGRIRLVLFSLPMSIDVRASALREALP